jgi:hypothetical protein
MRTAMNAPASVPRRKMSQKKARLKIFICLAGIFGSPGKT